MGSTPLWGSGILTNRKTSFKLGLTLSNQRHSFEYSIPIECICILRRTHTKKAGKCQSATRDRKVKGLQCFHPWLLLPYTCAQEDMNVWSWMKARRLTLRSLSAIGWWVTLASCLSICKRKGWPEQSYNASREGWYTCPHFLYRLGRWVSKHGLL